MILDVYFTSITTMPMHTSKNYYKAEQEYFEQKTWDQWTNGTCKWCRRYSYCFCDDYYDDYYVEHNHYGSWSNTYPYQFDCGAYTPCEFCYEYKTTHDRKSLIEEYFTPQQILETLQTHLQDTNCWCYERGRTHVLRRRVNSMLHPRRSSIDVSIPKEYEPDVMTDCVIRILDKQLGNEVKALHEYKVRNEKMDVLAKYGLTLDDYNKIRIENQTLYESMNVQENPIVLPKQKFIKVKEATLKVGEF